MESILSDYARTSHNQQSIDPIYPLWNSVFLLISNIILPSAEMAFHLQSLRFYPFLFLSSSSINIDLSTINIDLSSLFSCAHGFSKHLGHLIPAEQYHKIIQAALNELKTFDPETSNPDLFLSAFWIISDGFQCAPQVIISLFSGKMGIQNYYYYSPIFQTMIDIFLFMSNEDFLIPIFRILTQYLQFPTENYIEKEKAVVNIFNLNFGQRFDLTYLLHVDNPRNDIKIEVLRFLEAVLTAYSQFPPDDYVSEEEEYRPLKWSDQEDFFLSLTPTNELGSEYESQTVSGNIIFQMLLNNIVNPYDLFISSLKAIYSYVSNVIPPFFEQITFPQIEIYVDKALEIIDLNNEDIMTLFLDTFIAFSERNRFDGIQYFIEQEGLAHTCECWSDNPSVLQRIDKINILMKLN